MPMIHTYLNDALIQRRRGTAQTHEHGDLRHGTARKIAAKNGMARHGTAQRFWAQTISGTERHS